MAFRTWLVLLSVLLIHPSFCDVKISGTQYKGYTRVCDGRQKGWIESQEGFQGGVIFCDMGGNPCDGRCPIRRGRLPISVTLSPTMYEGESKVDPKSTCGEKILPGGFRFSPKQCNGDQQGCITYRGRPMICVESRVTVDFPHVINQVGSDTSTTLLYLCLAVMAVLIVNLIVIVALISKILSMWMNLHFSGHLIDLGTGRWVDVTEICKGATAAHCDGTWKEGTFDGTMFLGDSTTNTQYLQLYLYPQVGYGTGELNHASLDVVHYTFWGIRKHKMPRCYVEEE